MIKLNSQRKPWYSAITVAAAIVVLTGSGQSASAQMLALSPFSGSNGTNATSVTVQGTVAALASNQATIGPDFLGIVCCRLARSIA